RPVLGHALTGFDLGGGRILGAHMSGPGGPSVVHADHYVCALPLNRARPLFTPAMRAAAPTLNGADALTTRWASSIQLTRSRTAAPATTSTARHSRPGSPS